MRTESGCSRMDDGKYLLRKRSVADVMRRRSIADARNPRYLPPVSAEDAVYRASGEPPRKKLAHPMPDQLVPDSWTALPWRLSR